jgi:DNA-binding NarL/FixJ family response regulator
MRDCESDSSARIRVLVADSSRIHSQLLAEVIERNRDMVVVASVSCGRELLETARKTALDIAVVGSTLDESPTRAFEIVHELRTIRPNVKTIMLLESSRRETVVEAFRAGARGIFSKNESHKTLCKCIRCVHDGQVWANRKDLIFALDALITTPVVRAVDANGINLLSKRELEVVRCVAEGLTNNEIGQRLGLSKHTIKNYLLRIFDKVGVSNRMELLFLTLSQPNNSHNPKNKSGSSPNDGEAASAELTTVHLKLARDCSQEDGGLRDPIAAYMWCLLAERSNVDTATEIDSLKLRLEQALNPDQISAAENMARERSKNPVRTTVVARKKGADSLVAEASSA